jgi:hypothetical protein
VGKINKVMNYFFTLIGFFFSLIAGSQTLTCEAIKTTGVHYACTGVRSGTAKLFNADTAITNRMKWKKFEMKKVSELSPEETAELSPYKFGLTPTDTVIFYDWDMLHNGAMAYHGKAVGKVRINCADSTMHIYKFLLKKETVNYVPSRFKIIKTTETNFIINDKNHPYLNVNYYFKK